MLCGRTKEEIVAGWAGDAVVGARDLEKTYEAGERRSMPLGAWT
jgi:hypothetical protein